MANWPVQKQAYYTIDGDATSYGIRIVCNGVPDTPSNSSLVTVDVYLLHPAINISKRTGSVVIDGTTFNFTKGSLEAEKGTTHITTKSKTVVHNDDGKREVTVSASFPYDLDSKTYGRIKTAKVSATLTLDEIPRSSEIVTMTKVVEVNGENAWTVTLSKHADAFRHKATLTFGDESITTEAFDTTTSVVIPTGWLELIPTQQEGTASASIQTYSDSTCMTAIGEPVSRTFGFRVPASAAPVLTSGWVTLSPYNDGTAASGMTGYIQGYSRARAIFDQSKVQAQYGAQIVSLIVEHDGVTSGSMTGVLGKSGAQTVKCIAVDSRGMKSTEERNITVLEYFKPTLSDVTIHRCTSSGAENDAGTFLSFKATCNYAACGGENTAALRAAWKPVAQSVWTNDTTIPNGQSAVLGAGALSTTQSYKARIIATDALGNMAAIEVLIATAEVDLNLRDGGGGAAFGKYAEYDDLLDCAWRFQARGGIVGVSIYSGAETEHGVRDGAKVYQRVMTGSVSANTATVIGSIEGFGSLVFAHGAAGNAAIRDISVDSAGVVTVTAPKSGTAHVIIVYTKE